MMLWIRMAWRNTFRTTRRTVITGLAIGVGLASLMFTDALIIGTVENMRRSATQTFLGDTQIHAAGYRESGDVETVIVDAPGVLNALNADPAVEQNAPRVFSFGMLASPADACAVELAGVEPAAEQHLSEIDEHITDGTYFTDGGARDILIGSGLAAQLSVGPGDKVVVTATQARSGDLAQDLFRVAGIFTFGITEMDRGMACIRLAAAQEMLGLDGGLHEIAVRLSPAQRIQDGETGFAARYTRGGNEAVSWRQVLPELHAAITFYDFSTMIIAAILFSIIALVIINTLFMSLYERMFEFGVLRAVGTRPAAIARLILLEAACLSMVSILTGLILGAAAIAIVGHTGIDYTGIEFGGTIFSRPIFPAFALRQFIQYPLWVLLFTVAAAVYPAVYAARMNPIEAMRRSM